ncbi:MAG: MFS transporter [Sporichthyaceae bacterium]
MASLSDLRAVLAHRDFRRLFATRLSAQASDGAFQVALASYVFFSPERAGSAQSAAATFAVLLLPYTVVGPFAGVFLDRWRRRQILLVANLIRAVLVCVVATFPIYGNTGPAFYVLALAAISVNRFFLTALSAALPRVVAREELVMANSVSVTAGSLAAMTGGGLGLALGLVLEGSGGDAALMLSAGAGYLVSARLAVTMDRDLLGPDLAAAPAAVRAAVRHVAAGLAEGAAHIWSRRGARDALLATAVQRFCYGSAAIAALLLYRNNFNDPESDGDAALAGLGVVFAAGGVGFLLAAMATPALVHRFGKPRCIVTALSVAGLLGFGLSAPYTPALVVAASFALGACAQVMKICVDTLVQENIDDVHRGRAFALYDVLFNLAFVAAAAVAALTLPDDGESYPMLGVVSALYLITAVVFLNRSRATTTIGQAQRLNLTPRSE